MCPFSTRMSPTVALAASISLRSHEQAIMSTLLGHRGTPSRRAWTWFRSSNTRSNGKGAVCLTGPMPRGAAWRASMNAALSSPDHSPFLFLNVAMACSVIPTVVRNSAASKTAIVRVINAGVNAYGSGDMVPAISSHLAALASRGPRDDLANAFAMNASVILSTSDGSAAMALAFSAEPLAYCLTLGASGRLMGILWSTGIARAVDPPCPRGPTLAGAPLAVEALLVLRDLGADTSARLMRRATGHLCRR